MSCACVCERVHIPEENKANTINVFFNLDKHSAGICRKMCRSDDSSPQVE